MLGCWDAGRIFRIAMQLQRSFCQQYSVFMYSLCLTGDFVTQ